MSLGYQTSRRAECSCGGQKATSARRRRPADLEAGRSVLDGAHTLQLGTLISPHAPIHPNDPACVTYLVRDLNDEFKDLSHADRRELKLYAAQTYPGGIFAGRPLPACTTVRDATIAVHADIDADLHLVWSVYVDRDRNWALTTDGVTPATFAALVALYARHGEAAMDVLVELCSAAPSWLIEAQHFEELVLSAADALR